MEAALYLHHKTPPPKDYKYTNTHIYIYINAGILLWVRTIIGGWGGSLFDRGRESDRRSADHFQTWKGSAWFDVEALARRAPDLLGV